MVQMFLFRKKYLSQDLPCSSTLVMAKPEHLGESHNKCANPEVSVSGDRRFFVPSQKKLGGGFKYFLFLPL